LHITIKKEGLASEELDRLVDLLINRTRELSEIYGKEYATND